MFGIWNIPKKRPEGMLNINVIQFPTKKYYGKESFSCNNTKQTLRDWITKFCTKLKSNWSRTTGEADGTDGEDVDDDFECVLVVELDDVFRDEGDDNTKEETECE